MVEWTLVDIAASVPLILPLVRRWGKTPPTNSYELKHTPGHSISVTGGTARRKRTLGQTELETRADSSSESVENILQCGEGKEDVMPKQDLVRVESFEEDVEAQAWVGNMVELEVERRQRAEVSVGVVAIGFGVGKIVKQTSYDVSYDEMRDDIDAAKREMWMAKELPKIPWEAQELPRRS